MAEHTHLIDKIIKRARPFPDIDTIKSYSQVGEQYSKSRLKAGKRT